MSELVEGFQTAEGTKKYDFNFLGNVPNVIKSEDNLAEFIQNKIDETSGAGASLSLDSTLSKEGYAADAAAVGQALDGKLDDNQLQTAINTALQQAKDSGAFDGAPGEKYVLTDEDKNEIVNSVLSALPTWSGGEY